MIALTRRAWVRALIVLQTCFVIMWIATYRGSSSAAIDIQSCTGPCPSNRVHQRSGVACSNDSEVQVSQSTVRPSSSLTAVQTAAMRPKPPPEQALQLHQVDTESASPEVATVSTQPQTLQRMKLGELNYNKAPPRRPDRRVNPSIYNLVRDTKLVSEGSGNIFVSMKTSSSLHAERLPQLFLTWLQMFNGSQIHIVTDAKRDSVIKKAEDFGMTVTESRCSLGHGIMALCCKSGLEYDQYYTTLERGEEYDWFCHFDDDMYVNVPNLVSVLKRQNSNESVYLGHYARHWGAKEITEAYTENFLKSAVRKGKTFYYALGPAYCISKELMTKLPLFFRGGNTFASTCHKAGFPDDATIGVIIDHYLGFRQFEVETMLNELDKPQPQTIPASDCRKLVTVSYLRDSYYHTHKNMKSHLEYTLEIPMFHPDDDPTGFLSLQCFLHPWTHWC